MIRNILILALCFVLSALPVAAQDNVGVGNPNRDMPLEITADTTLEWHRNTQKFIAKGNAIAKQGDVTIKADILTADYRETSAQDFEIYRLTASGNVELANPGNSAFGDEAVYDIDQGVAVMTGNNLKMVTPEQTVTARDSFEYFVTESRLTAIGDAQVHRENNHMRANEFSAFFTKNAATGKNDLTKLTASGGVVITTPEEVLSGNRGIYTASTQVAEIFGDVKIERGPNVLEGDTADVNLQTNVSRIHGSKSSGGRVRGVFYPDSEKKKENSN